MELNNPINIFTKLGYEASNVLSVRMLGIIAKEKGHMPKLELIQIEETNA